MSRKTGLWKSSTALVVAGVLAVASGCGSAAGSGNSANTTTGATQAKAGPVLDVGNFTEYLPHVIIRQFEAKYHIKVNYSTYAANADLLAKMQAGDRFDVAVASDFMVQQMTDLGLLQKINFHYVPDIGNIAPGMRHLAFDPSGDYSVPYLWGAAAIAVNTHKVHGTITTYSDLLQPQFKNELVFLDSPRTMVGIALMMDGHNMNDTNAADLKQAQQTLLKFRPQVKVFDNTEPHVELLNGEAIAGITWTGEGAMAWDQDPWIVPVFPSVGVNKWVDNLIIPANSQNKIGAEDWIQFLLEPKISAELENDQQYTDPNTAATPYLEKSLQKNPWINLPAAVVNQGEVETAIPSAANEQFNTIWAEFKQAH